MSKNPLSTSNPHQKQLARLLADIARSGGHRLWSVFRDFLHVHALALSNVADRAQREKREAEYLSVIKPYTRDELLRFREGMGFIVAGLEEDPFQDFLGSLFMVLELGSDHAGQFFTPYADVCSLMARLNLGADDLRARIADHGYVSINDPCAGGGAMLIAAAEAIQDAGFNYQKSMHVVCQDIDLTAVHMTYIQLTLLHVPAVVIHGNSLLVEERSHWFTLAHTMGNWSRRLALDRRDAASLRVQVESSSQATPGVEESPVDDQGQAESVLRQHDRDR
jgi:hypothetical protein